MNEDAHEQMNRVNMLSRAIKYQANNAVKERHKKYKELFSENQAYMYC
jgi:hypothetical protein